MWAQRSRVTRCGSPEFGLYLDSCAPERHGLITNVPIPGMGIYRVSTQSLRHCVLIRNRGQFVGAVGDVPAIDQGGRINLDVAGDDGAGCRLRGYRYTYRSRCSAPKDERVVASRRLADLQGPQVSG